MLVGLTEIGESHYRKVTENFHIKTGLVRWNLTRPGRPEPAHLSDLVVHPKGRHDLPAACQITGSSNPIPHPGFWLGIHDLKDGIFDLLVTFYRLSSLAHLRGGNNSGIFITELRVLLDILDEASQGVSVDLARPLEELLVAEHSFR